MKATWNLSGNSIVSGRVTALERRHEHFAQRNFSGTTGQLDYTWTPTGKLRLVFTAKRDIDSWWDAGASYRVSDTLSFAPVWQAGARIAVRARFEHTQVDYRGPVIVDFRSPRSDTQRRAQVAVDWSPLRYVTFSASLARDSRSSTDPGFAFRDTIANLGVLLTF